MAGPNFWGYTQKPEQTLGTRVGGDIGEVLQGLAHHKSMQVKANNNKQLLQSLGIRPDVAAPLAHQSDENIFNFLKQFEGFDIGAQAPQPVQQPQQYNQNQPNYPQEMVQNQPQGQIAAKTTPYNMQKDLINALSSNPSLANQISPEQIGQLLQNQAAQQALNPLGKQPQAQQQPTGIKTKAAADAERTARAQQLKEQHELSKLDLKEEQEARKESKKVLATLNKEAKAAKENDMKLDRMSELIKTGKLSDPAFHNLLTTAAHGLWGVGLDLHFLESPESQEFTKLSNDMIKGIKDIFGSRVTDLDLKSYAKTLPNLSQSNEGKERIIRNLKISNQANKLKESTAKQIIRSNGNIVPADLELLVEEQVNPKLDALAEKFIHNTEPIKSSKTQHGINFKDTFGKALTGTLTSPFG